MDRLLDLKTHSRLFAWHRAKLVLLGLLATAACTSESNTGQAVGGRRFEGITSSQTSRASGFCDKTYPKDGPDARKYAPPPTRPLPANQSTVVVKESKSWRWINVWATWCEPCREEMPLLARWKEGLAREGAPFSLELVSIDGSTSEAALRKSIENGSLPGPVIWLRAEEDFGPFLDTLGIDRDAAIPIHALVDPSGMIRCTRVGAIHDRDYGLIRSLLTGG